MCLAGTRSMSLRPNKRLKLAGGDRFKGSGVLCAGAHQLSFNYAAPAGESPAAEARSVRQRTSLLRSHTITCNRTLQG